MWLYGHHEDPTARCSIQRLKTNALGQVQLHSENILMPWLCYRPIGGFWFFGFEVFLLLFVFFVVFFYNKVPILLCSYSFFKKCLSLAAVQTKYFFKNRFVQ